MTSQYVIEYLNETRLWYIVLTNQRAELNTKNHLEQEGFITYLPQDSVRRQWAGHKKKIHIPAIPRCVFIYATEEEIQRVQKQYTVFPPEIISNSYQNQ